MSVVTLSALALNGLSSSYASFGMDLVRRLSGIYNFDYDAAMRELNLENLSISCSASMKCKKICKPVMKESVKRMIPRLILPFCGEINVDWCEGVRSNHDLYTQCTNERVNDLYCNTCQKQADGNSNGKPSYGNIRDRQLAGDDYEVNGKKALSYAKVMSRQKISREDAVLEASKFGWSLDEKHFVLKSVHRGRPKVCKDVNETPEKKCRGRPKKEKKLISDSIAGDDVIAALVAKAKGTPRIEFEDDSVENATSTDSEKDSENDSEKESEKGSETDSETDSEKESEKSGANKSKSSVSKAAKEAEKAAKASEKLAKKCEKQSNKNKNKNKNKSEVKAVEEQSISLGEESVEEEVEEESAEEVEIEVKRWVHKEKSYLKSSEDKVYDMKTQEVIGMWNKTTGEIESLSEEEDEESDD